MTELEKIPTEELINKIKGCDSFMGFRNIKVYCKLENGLTSIKNCLSCIIIMEGQN